MFGPGKYVPDPTEGIIDVQDLLAPQIVAYDWGDENRSKCPVESDPVFVPAL
jgi:hypothetical protein